MNRIDNEIMGVGRHGADRIEVGVVAQCEPDGLITTRRLPFSSRTPDSRIRSMPEVISDADPPTMVTGSLRPITSTSGAVSTERPSANSELGLTVACAVQVLPMPPGPHRPPASRKVRGGPQRRRHDRPGTALPSRRHDHLRCRHVQPWPLRQPAPRIRSARCQIAPPTAAASATINAAMQHPSRPVRLVLFGGNAFRLVVGGLPVRSVMTGRFGERHRRCRIFDSLAASSASSSHRTAVPSL